MVKKRSFPTQFDRIRVRSVVGDRKKVMYNPEFDDEGNFTLVESGEADLYDEIQSHRDSVDINVILKRYQNGDLTALERVQGVYEDITDIPRNYAGILNSMMQSRKIFDGLPVETKANFDHSFEKFIASMDSPDFFNILSGRQDSDRVIDDPASKDIKTEE